MSEVKGKGAEVPEQDEDLEVANVEPAGVASRHPIVGKVDEEKLKKSKEMLDELPRHIAEAQAALQEAGAYVAMHSARDKQVPLADLVGFFQSGVKAEQEELVSIAAKVTRVVKEVAKSKAA